MKKRILSLTLVLCMLLPLLPLTAFASTVEGLSYDSPYARDVYFGNVPTTSWYQGLGGDQYGTAYNGTAFDTKTKYADYMTAFDAMFPFADAIITDREDLVPGYSAEIYDQVPADVAAAMNTTTLNGYVTREVLGMARESCHKEYNEVQYMYAYTLDPTQELGYVGPTNLPKIFLVSGTQSDEKSAFFGLYYLIYDLLNNYEDDPVLRYLRHNVKLVVVPCVSPGGINQNTYWNANYVNVNRNYDADFKQVGGYDFVEDENGEWLPYEKTYTDSQGDVLTVTCYEKAADGNGTHTQIKKWSGIYSETGDTLGSKWLQTQNTGYAPFDQAEACAIRDLYAKHTDTFLFIDYHTNTSGSLDKGAWKNLNWLSLGAMYDDYCQKLINAAAWHIDRYTENVYLDYNLSEHGVHEGQVMSYATMGTGTTANGGGNTDEWMKRQGVLSMTLESISGFPKTDAYPNGCLGGRYSPATQKLGSELMANWLIAVLAEYAYDGDIPTDSYSTAFGPMTGNYPTISGIEKNDAGDFDTTDLPVLTPQTIEQRKELTVTYHGGWQVGYTLINSDATFKGDANFTPFTQVWQYEGTGKNLYLTDAAGQWATHGGFGVGKSTMHSAQNWSMAWKSAGGWQADTTVRYTAEYSGKIEIDVTNLLFETSSTSLVILKNGVPIYEIEATPLSSTKLLKSSTAADGTVTYYWGSGNVVPLSRTCETTVAAGDTIDFVAHFDAERWPSGADSLIKTARYGLKDYDFRISYYEESSNSVTVNYSGTLSELSITAPAKSADVLPFLKWYNGETALSSGDASNATARINPALLGTWIANDATWQEAIEGYKKYLRSLTSVSTASGWIPGSMETEGNAYLGGNTFVPFTALSFLSKNDAAQNIFGVSTVGKNIIHSMAFDSGAQFMVSEQYFEAQLERYCAPAVGMTVAEAAADIRIPFSALPSVTTAVGQPLTSGVTGSSKTTVVGALDLRNSTALLQVWSDQNNTSSRSKAVALQYTVPAGVYGKATLDITDIFYGMQSDVNAVGTYRFGVFVNGQYLFGADRNGYIKVNRDLDGSDGRIDLDGSGTNDYPGIRNTLKALGAFTVNAGDVIEVRFMHEWANCYVSLNPVMNLTIERTESWTGKNTDVDYKKPTSYETLFKWYNPSAGGADALVAASKTINADAYAVINPYFTDPDATHNYKITANMTYAEAVAVYKEYMRNVTSVKSYNNWQIGGAVSQNDPYDVTGTGKFSPITNLGFLSNRNIFGVSIKSDFSGYNTTYKCNISASDGSEVWVSDVYFEELLSLYCLDYAYIKSGSTWNKVTEGVNLIDYSTKIGDFTNSTLTYAMLKAQQSDLGVVPHAWTPNGSERPTSAYSANKNSSSAYIGMMLRPGQAMDPKGTGQVLRGVTSVGYTVPEKLRSIAILTLDSLTYGDNGGTTIYNNSFEWQIRVDGVARTAWATFTPTTTGTDSGTALDSINNVLKDLEIAVTGGEVIEFCVRRNSAGKAIYVSPALTVNFKASNDPVRLVQFANGGAVAKRQLAAKGTSVADLIAAYRETDADFAANGCYINGTWYAAGAELPAIGSYDVVIDDFRIEAEATLEIGATYKMNVYLPAISGVTEAGVKVNGKTLKGTLEGGKYKVTVAEVYAKDVLDAKVYYTPYYVVNGTEQVSAKSFVLRAADMLDEYVNGDYSAKAKELAQATLDYATVAKAYFAGKMADAATLARLAAYDTAISGETAGKLNKIGDTYTFTAATLQIGETINFIVAIGNKDGSPLTSLPAGTTLAIAGKEVETTEFTPGTVNGQKVMLTAITGVPEKEFAAQQAFELLDANGNVLASMTYGVKDYCVRAFGSAKAAEANMIRAIYAIGKAAAAYDASTNGDAGETEKVSLDGKKVIFVGNSHIYWGRAVIGGSGNDLSKRNNDQGTFYQLCKAFGQNVTVTNWTFGSHGLSESFGPDACGGVGGCSGEGVIHEEYLTDHWYDYVILSPGSRYENGEADFLADVQYLVDFFTDEENGGNPNTKFVCIGNMSPYGYSNLKQDLKALVANHYKDLEKDGFIISDWGTIVYDILQKGSVDGGNATYKDSTFVVKDGFHPNMLSGYINALTTFCAITGESPIGMPFPSELLTAENHEKLDIDAYIADTTNNYLDPSDTNVKEILTNDAEILAIQKMIARYLEAKPYRDFNFE